MSQTSHPSLSPEVFAALNRLRGQIRRYVFWEGLALVAVLAGVLFWGSFLLDWAYFGISRLELPRWLRAGFLVGGVGLLAAGGVSLLAFRTLRIIRGRALALLLERRFPELGDGLITAVEASEGEWTSQGTIADAMLARTIADAGRTVQRLNLETVFNPRPLRRTAIAAVGLIVSVLGLAVVDSAAMERWIDGYWRLQPVYWPRQTELIVRVVSQPGDRLREFTEGRYRHPRGGDLLLQIETAPGKQQPPRVRLDYRLRGGSWKRTYLATSGNQPFVQSFPALLDSLEFWVSGGDYAAPAPWRVDVVDPPQLDGIELAVLYPEYTGLNRRSDAGPVERTRLPFQGAQMTLPLGSDVQFVGVSNKPLSLVRVEATAGSERLEWTLQRDPETQQATASLLVRAHDDLPQRSASFSAEQAAACLATDGRSFTLPLVLRKTGDVELRDVLSLAQEQGPALPSVIPWPADTVLRIQLEDVDGIGSPEPLRLTLNSQPDQAPVVEVELKGISPSITRQARIPVAGLVRDEYGVVRSRFEYLIDAETAWRPQEFAVPPTGVVREFELARSPSEAYERFDVLPLDLSLKQRLALTVYAADGDTLYGPNEHRSQKFVFTIVSVEELQSLLYAKELNLRNRFEQILQELKDLQKDLELHRQRGETLEATQGDERRQTEAALSACAERSLLSVRKNAAEMVSVEQAFGEIREELVNNAAQTPQNMARLETKILAPLKAVNAEGFPAVDASLGLFSLANQKGRNPVPAIVRSEEDVAALVKSLEQVLLDIRELETFQELLELYKGIIDLQNEVMEDTKTQRKEKALRALE